MQIKKRMIALTALVLAAVYAYYWAFYDIQRLKGVEVLAQAVSPDGAYMATVELTNGGATTDFGVVGSVTDNRSGKRRNLYWQYHCDDAEIKWLDHRTVQINGVTLDAVHDTYDYRHHQELE